MQAPILSSIALSLNRATSITDDVVEAIKESYLIKDISTREDVISCVKNITTIFRVEHNGGLHSRNVVNNVIGSVRKAKHYSNLTSGDFV